MGAHLVHGFSGLGSGVASNPFQIETLQQLDEIRNEPSASYIITQNIDASETANWNLGDHDGNAETAEEPQGWEPIESFTGVLNGGNNSIQNLYINRPNPNSPGVGLFGFAGFRDDTTSRALIQNLNMADCDILGSDYVGAVVGEATRANIINCYSSLSKVAGNERVGGIIGGVTGVLYSAEVAYCHSSAHVVGVKDVGGILGYAQYRVNITWCSSNGYVEGDEHVGGLAGRIHGANVNYCYSTGETRGGIFVGGIFGYGGSSKKADVTYRPPIYVTRVSDCYATGNINGDYYAGGIAGKMEGMMGGWAPIFSQLTQCYVAGHVNGIDNIGVIIGYGFMHHTTRCYYNYTINPGLVAYNMEYYWTFPEALPLDENQMRAKAEFGYFDFANDPGDGALNVWAMVEGATYPHFAPTQPFNITLTDLSVGGGALPVEIDVEFRWPAIGFEFDDFDFVGGSAIRVEGVLVLSDDSTTTTLPDGLASCKARITSATAAWGTSNGEATLKIRIPYAAAMSMAAHPNRASNELSLQLTDLPTAEFTIIDSLVVH